MGPWLAVERQGNEHFCQHRPYRGGFRRQRPHERCRARQTQRQRLGKPVHPHFGTVGAGWVQQNIQGSTERYLNASRSVSLPAHISTTLSYTRSFTDASSHVQLLLSVPLGREDTLSAQVSRDTPRMDYRHQPDDEAGGWSWELGEASANDVKDMRTSAT